MGEGEHGRAQRPTRRLDRTQLARLTRKSTSTTPPPPADAERRSGPSVPRAMTIEDPMTTQLLAEVARRAETIELDDATIDEAVAVLDKPARTIAKEHPHTLRRTR